MLESSSFDVSDLSSTLYGNLSIRQTFIDWGLSQPHFSEIDAHSRYGTRYDFMYQILSNGHFQEISNKYCRTKLYSDEDLRLSNEEDCYHRLGIHKGTEELLGSKVWNSIDEIKTNIDANRFPICNCRRMVTGSFLEWCTTMETDFRATIECYEYNWFIHLKGPNGGYDAWITPLAKIPNLDKFLPKMNNSYMSNKQGIYLSTVFAKEILDRMVKRASELGALNVEYNALNAKGDTQISSYVNAIQSMAGSNLNMSLENAKKYAENLYNAYVHFLNNRVTPSELTILCGGCDNPRYVNSH